ncbi:MAG: chalcone isomerase family protein [Proteobacteria bacterium]|nr:chalcone isomerase family protein [Pseudomonadota bacterium]HQR04420.1 chalcone isomerase family protein [Rhodocyclaceae bacterium]
MHHRLYLPALILATLLSAVPLHAAEVAGVRVDDHIQVNGTHLQLNGAGLRTKFFFKVYVAALYVVNRSNSSTQLLDSREPSRMVLKMLRSVDADTLFQSLHEGLQANLSASELSAIQTQTEQLGALMKQIGSTRIGDTLSIDLAPESVTVGYNGESRGTIRGGQLSRALLGIWLGEHPAEASLKKALLGS